MAGINLDSDSDNDLPPPPSKKAFADPSINLDGSDDDELPPPPSKNLAAADSLVVGSPKGGGIDLDGSDEDDLPPPKPAGAAASPSSPSLASTAKKAVAAPPAAAAAAGKNLPAAAGAAAAAGQHVDQRARSNTTKPRRSVSDVSKEDYLFKQSPSWPYVMQKRWVTLKGRLLSYFEEKGSTNPSGTVDLKGAEISDSPASAKAPHAIGISGDTPALKGRTFIFAASNREEYLQWLDLLKLVTTEPKNNELHWFEKMASGMY